MKIAFQGEPGAYSEQAVFDYFGEVETQPCESFDAVFEAVNSGQCESALIPIENSLAGSIHQNYDLLLRNNLYINGEKIGKAVIGSTWDDLTKTATIKSQFIYEGTTGIQANDLIGRKMAREGGATFKTVLGMMRTVDAELAGNTQLTALHSRFTAAVDAVTNVQLQLTTAQTDLMQADIPTISTQLSLAKAQQTALISVIAQLNSTSNSLFSKL